MSPVRSPLRSATRPPAYSPLQPRPSGYPKELLLLWNAKDGIKMKRGGEWDYGYAGNQYDSDGVSVGAVPAIHYDADGNLRGVWGGPAYQNLIQNSGFAGAVSGTPGTAPTNWSRFSSGTAAASVFSGSTMRLTATSGRCRDAQGPVSVAANTTYRFTVQLEKHSGSIPLQEVIDIAAGPAGSTVAFELDGAVALGTDLIPDGVHSLSAVLSVSSTAGVSVSLIYGVGSYSGAPFSADITFWNPQLVASPYVFPYVKTAANSTTSVVSAAGTSSNNGMYLPLTTALTEAFAGQQNMIMNSKFEGAAVGTTNPTNWGTVYPNVINGISTAIVGTGVGYIDVRWHGTATAAFYPFSNNPLASRPAAVAGDVWGAAARVTLLDGSMTGVTDLYLTVRETDNAGASLANTNLNIKSLLDGRELFVTRTLTHASTTKVSWLVHGVILSGATVDFTIRISEPSLVKNAAALPYVATGIDETISTPATCTVAALVSMGVSSAELVGNTYDHNTFTIRDSRGPMFYQGHATDANLIRIVGVTDGTAYPRIDATWSANEMQLKLFQTKSDGSQFRIGSRRYNADMTAIDANIVWGSWTSFDGSFNPTGVLRWFMTNLVPVWARHLQIWNRGAVSDADILKWAERS